MLTSQKTESSDYDLFNLDRVFGAYILPGLKALRIEEIGAADVKDEDVPAYMSAGLIDYELQVERWNYVLDEMIHAFESLNTSWESDVLINGWEIIIANGRPELRKPGSYSRPWTTPQDMIRLYRDRISNGFLLFGKYYQELWK